MKNLLKLIRPKQWSKNVFVLVPMFFGGKLFDVPSLQAAFITFFAFCFAASSIYCFNDLVDVEADRRHPVKCHRPVASGAVSVAKAYILMMFMFALSMLTMTLLEGRSWTATAIVLFYWLLNIAYCKKLKDYAIIDVCVIAFGFVLRILVGGIAVGVQLTSWIVLMTFLLTLFLSFTKRRDDVIRMNQTGEAPRKNTIRYNETFINQAITITGAVMLVCYIMYTVSPEVVSRFSTSHLYLTSVFVLLGLLRFIQIAVVDEKSGDPTKVILLDRFIQFVVVGWGLMFLLIIYFKRLWSVITSLLN